MSEAWIYLFRAILIALTSNEVYTHSVVTMQSMKTYSLVLSVHMHDRLIVVGREHPELQECTRNVEEYGDEHSS